MSVSVTSAERYNAYLFVGTVRHRVLFLSLSFSEWLDDFCLKTGKVTVFMYIPGLLYVSLLCRYFSLVAGDGNRHYYKGREQSQSTTLCMFILCYYHSA